MVSTAFSMLVVTVLESDSAMVLLGLLRGVLRRPIYLFFHLRIASLHIADQAEKIILSMNRRTPLFSISLLVR